MSDWRDRWRREREARAKRTVPMPVFAFRPANWCRWCGGEILHGRAAQRSWHDGRADEPDCLAVYYLHSRRENQFAHVANRDGLRCWDCKEAPERWLRDQYESVVWDPTWRRGDDPLGAYVGVQRVTALEVEHETHLWAVAHLPDDVRRTFFGPMNLRLRCPPCHKAKTAREAAERAKKRRAAPTSSTSTASNSNSSKGAL